MLLEVQCKVSTVSDDLGCFHLLVLVHCVFWVHSQRSHLAGHFRALHASFCWQALWRCWFHFQAGLSTCPHCQRYQKLVQWPRCYCAWLASKLTWPEPHREFRWETPDPTMQMTWTPENLDERPQTQQCRWPEAHRESRWETPDTMQMTWTPENLDERPQTQQCWWPEGRCQSNLGFITPEQCHRLITSLPRRIDAAIHAKVDQPSIECIEMNILFRSLKFLFKISSFYWYYVIF